MHAYRHEYAPSAEEPLHGIVQCMTHVHVPGVLPPEQLTPDSYIKLSLVLDGEPLYLDGQGQTMDRHDGIFGHIPPRQGFVTTSTGPFRCLVVTFFPSGFHRLFGGPVHRFNGSMVRLEQVIGPLATRLCTELRSTPDAPGAFVVVKRYLITLASRHAQRTSSPIAQLEHYVRERKGMVMVQQLAELAGLSERQLERRFKEEVGLSPKAFCSVVRFNHVYSEMKRTGKLDLDVALASGYFDVSHMMKELSHFLGKTPKHFVSTNRQ